MNTRSSDASWFARSAASLGVYLAALAVANAATPAPRWAPLTALPLPEKNNQIVFAQAGEISGAASTAPGNPRLWLGKASPDGPPDFTEVKIDPALLRSSWGWPAEISSLTARGGDLYASTSAGVYQLVPRDGAVAWQPIDPWAYDTTAYVHSVGLYLLYEIRSWGRRSGYWAYELATGKVEGLTWSQAAYDGNRIRNSKTKEIFGWYDLRGFIWRGAGPPPLLIATDKTSLDGGQTWAPLVDETGSKLKITAIRTFGDQTLAVSSGKLYLSTKAGTSPFRDLGLPIPSTPTLFLSPSNLVIAGDSNGLFWARLGATNAPAPAAFTNVSPMDGEVFGRGVAPARFRWEASGGATSYDIVLQGPTDTAGKKVGTVTTNEWILDRALEPGTWSWWIIARGFGGETTGPTSRFLLGSDPVEIYLDESFPPGTTPQAYGSARWEFTRSTNPEPLSGETCLTSTAATDYSQVWFDQAGRALRIRPGDRLFFYLWIDPSQPAPESVVVQFQEEGETWEHRIYLGGDLAWMGSRRGTRAAFHLGRLPQPGRWTMIEFPANWIGVEGKSISGVAFGIAGGRAAFDRLGVRSTSPFVWVDDALPQGATSETHGWSPWVWDTQPEPFAGTLALQSEIAAAGLFHQLYFTGVSQPALITYAADRPFAHVRLDPAYPPSTVMLQWRRKKTGEWVRALWGEVPPFAAGWVGTPAAVWMGPLPQAGVWYRLEVLASDLGLEPGDELDGMAFSLVGGRAAFDRAGVEPATAVTLWDDGLPPGASVGEYSSPGWSHTATGFASPLSGESALVSGIEPGFAQYYFHGAKPVTVHAGDEVVFVHVYLDPATPPDYIALQFYSDDTWEHRAIWTSEGAPDWVGNRLNTPAAQILGPLPPTGRWVRLEVRMDDVGLGEGQTFTGMAMTLGKGRAAFDTAGILSVNPGIPYTVGPRP